MYLVDEVIKDLINGTGDPYNRVGNTPLEQFQRDWAAFMTAINPPKLSNGLLFFYTN